MSYRLYCELDAPADKEWVSSNKERVHSIAGKCFKDSFDFATVTRLNDLDLKPDIRRCCRYVLRYALCLPWIDKQTNTRGGRNKFMQQSKLFCSQFPNEEIHAGRITARSAKAVCARSAKSSVKRDMSRPETWQSSTVGAEGQYISDSRGRRRSELVNTLLLSLRSGLLHWLPRTQLPRSQLSSMFPKTRCVSVWSQGMGPRSAPA